MKFSRLLLPMLLGLSLTRDALPQNLAAAKQQAREGRADAAIASLQAADQKQAEVQSLLCEVYGSIEHLDEAIRACEAAAQISPNNSAYALGLAHAYGSKADHSGALTGMRMVGKIRGAFERAVQLDGNNVDALSDLGEFYVDAPAIVGGGLDKARALVPRLQAVSPARAHRLGGMIASKSGDDASAETEFKAELAAKRSPEAYVDLANFERRRKRPDDAAAYARQAIQMDGARGGDTVDGARLLIEIKRDIPFAQDALRRYLAAPRTSAVTPLARVHTMLGQSLASTGDKAGAQAEFNAALSLAKDYAPARRALGQ